jgi:hypothetical protein
MFLDSGIELVHKSMPTKGKNLGRERRLKQRLEFPRITEPQAQVHLRFGPWILLFKY